MLLKWHIDPNRGGGLIKTVGNNSISVSNIQTLINKLEAELAQPARVQPSRRVKAQTSSPAAMTPGTKALAVKPKPARQPVQLAVVSNLVAPGPLVVGPQPVIQQQVAPNMGVPVTGPAIAVDNFFTTPPGCIFQHGQVTGPAQLRKIDLGKLMFFIFDLRDNNKGYAKLYEPHATMNWKKQSHIDRLNAWRHAVVSMHPSLPVPDGTESPPVSIFFVSPFPSQS